MADVDTGTTDLLADLTDGVGTITFNRPDRRNAMSDQMMSALAATLGLWKDSDDVGVVVVTGAGGHFCAGGDVKGFNERGGAGGTSGQVDPAKVESQRENQKATVGAIYTYPKPVIAAVPGAAAGAGLGFALSADVRIGTPKTVMATAFGGVALSGDYGVTWLLNQLVGPARARQYLFFNDRLRGEDLLDLGLLNWVVGVEELEAKTTELARQLADGSRGTLAAMKQNLIEAQTNDLFASMHAEVQRHLDRGTTDDHREAVAAFVEKRKPNFAR
ncbi:hypothetical protein EK0264_04675 [Epidermidibacterium keratini]|uniref:Enoyl-CoA hydratase n=1 Tax=Epidermidibacterium keratini TaxID=1891644 RepID=A0A7L4YKQ9_9ACTN|nr:enoyl-CoA hydratase-related protein [Epidermidibacterium keratini]QHB99647.1 hypothetical protein EK0264_04675 [Epidermidibacterium keratini]